MVGAINRTKEAEPRGDLRAAIFDALPDHIAVLDADGTIVDVNDAWRAFGAEHGLTTPQAGIGTRYVDCCPELPDDHSSGAARRGIQAVLGGERRHFELEYPCHGPDGIQRWFMMTAQRFSTATDDRWSVVSHRNITARKLAEQRAIAMASSFKVSEAHWRGVVENTPACISILDREGRRQFVNRGQGPQGRPPSLGRSILELTDPKHHEAVREALRAASECGEVQSFESQDPAGVWYSSQLAPLVSEGSFLGFLCISTDISAQKSAQAIQQRFVHEVLRASEDERRRIAHELHDETGQALTNIVVSLRSIENAAAPEIAARLTAVRSLVETTIDAVGRLAKGLHPAQLDRLGLSEAVRRLAERFEQTHKVQVRLHDEELSRLPPLSPAVAIVSYRVVQEALTNVAKHARATSVDIVFCARPNLLRIIVEDDGQGFDVEAVLTSEGSAGLGLMGIRERAALLGGTALFESKPGTSTTVVVDIPTEPP